MAFLVVDKLHSTSSVQDYVTLVACQIPAHKKTPARPKWPLVMQLYQAWLNDVFNDELLYLLQVSAP